jgi:hypothetical protein
VPVDNSDEQLLEILASLDHCREALRLDGQLDTAQLVSVAILDLRMKLNRIGDAELKALCDGIMLPASTDETPGDGQSSAQRRRPLLRVVK